MRIALQPSFILHHRPYRETSVIIDLLTQDHGRVALVARGVRKANSKLRALLQPFVPLLVTWQGKTELMSLTMVEASAPPMQLRGDCLLGAFYLNELLMRLLHKQDPHPELYTLYQQTLLMMQGEKLQQQTLRLFEKKLLEEIGYGLQLEYSVPDKQPIAAEKFYYFIHEQGFQLCEENEEGIVFSGKSLLALANEELDDLDCLRDVKRLMRMALAPLLGTQPLHSRKLFQDVIPA